MHLWKVNYGYILLKQKPENHGKVTSAVNDLEHLSKIFGCTLKIQTMKDFCDEMGLPLIT